MPILLLHLFPMVYGACDLSIIIHMQYPGSLRYDLSFFLVFFNYIILLCSFIYCMMFRYSQRNSKRQCIGTQPSSCVKSTLVQNQMALAMVRIGQMRPSPYLASGYLELLLMQFASQVTLEVHLSTSMLTLFQTGTEIHILPNIIIIIFTNIVVKRREYYIYYSTTASASFHSKILGFHHHHHHLRLDVQLSSHQILQRSKRLLYFNPLHTTIQF